MKKILSKLSAVVLTLSVALQNFASAGYTGDNGANLKGQVETIQKTISDIAMPAGAIFIFFSVLTVGFAIIKNKDKADDRMKSMESLLWVGIGAFVIGMSLVIGPAIASIMGN